MQLYLIRMISLAAIALMYMLFDIFNKRNVPTVFAYSTLAYAFVLTLLYLNLNTIFISAGIALAVLGLGYIVYKAGQLGAADVIEFAALSLIMPLQGSTLILTSAIQYRLPFMLSLLVNTGIVALIIVPIYYLPKAKRKLKKPLSSFVTRKELFKAVLIVIAYMTFMVFAVLTVRINYIGTILLVLMLISSSVVMLFSVPITYSMIEYMPVGKFDEGDIIAFNLMDQRKVDLIRSKIKSFDRLVTRDLIKRMKEKRIKERLPVYKEAIPFAFPIFIAVLLSIAIGNLLLFILAS